MSHNSHRRIEPTLGDPTRPETPPEDIGDLHADVQADARPVRAVRPPGGASPGRARRHHGWLWPLVAVFIVALVAVGWLNQNRLRAMLPRTQLNQLLAQADQALQGGHLEGGSHSAHALYAKVLDLAPDNGAARQGLTEVGQAELVRAGAAIASGDYARARINLANARNLLGGGAQVAAVAKQLEQATHPGSAVTGLITEAQAAMASGKLAGTSGAAALYAQVLVADPANQVAQHGLDRVGDILADKVQAALTAGDAVKAAAALTQLEHWVPHDGQLPTLRASLAAARKHAKEAVSTHLAAGQKALRDGHFGDAEDGGAEGQFQAVLAFDPNNAEAQAGLRKVAAALIVQANAAMDAGDRSQATALLKRAAGLAPRSDALAVARTRLAALTPSTVGEKALPAGGSTGVADSTAGATARPAGGAGSKANIQTLLQRAADAAKAGHLMLPPGASAYDLYQQVLAINGNNTRALAGLHGLPGIAVAHFHAAMKAANLPRADGYIAVLRSLEPDDPRLSGLTATLADAWLNRAQAALDQDNHDAAKQALAEARKLAPHAQRLSALTQRLNNG